MGLGTTHNAWHGAYSAFSRWREELAKVTGIPLPLMRGYYDDDIPGTGYTVETIRRFLPIEWESLKPDVLHFLLHHSDCDGDIPAELCAPLADRLTELLPLLDGDGGGHIGSYRDKTQKFIDGLRLAASLGEAVEFH